MYLIFKELAFEALKKKNIDTGDLITLNYQKFGVLIDIYFEFETNNYIPHYKLKGIVLSDRQYHVFDLLDPGISLYQKNLGVPLFEFKKNIRVLNEERLRGWILQAQSLSV